MNYIYGYAVGLDMTRRDLQMAMREKVVHGKSVKLLIFLHQLAQFIRSLKRVKLIVPISI